MTEQLHEPEHHHTHPPTVAHAYPPDIESSLRKEHRPARGLMYLLLALAGVTSFFLHLPFFDDLVGTSIYGIGLFFIVGGVTSGIGHSLRIKVLERAGYTLLIPAMAVLTVILFLEADENAARTFIGLLTMAFTAGLYGRARDLSSDIKLQRASAGGTGNGDK